MKRHPVAKPDRLYALKSLIERRGCVPMKDILEHLDVSRATAKRDIEFLRDRMGVPVEWDSFGQGYRIPSLTRRPDGAPRELPGLWFTDQEVDALLTMYDLVAEADDTGLVRQDLVPLRRRLLKMLHGSRSELRVLLERAKGAAHCRPVGHRNPYAMPRETLFGIDVRTVGHARPRTHQPVTHPEEH